METENTPTQTAEELTREVASLKADNDWLTQRLNNARNTIERVENYIKRAIVDGEIDAEETLVTDLCDILDLELTQQIEVTVTATWSGTLTIPIGKRVSDYEDYFECSVETTDAEMEFDGGYQPDSVEVEEA